LLDVNSTSKGKIEAMSQKNTIQTAMIMAAGYGTRLRQLTKNKPKSLLTIDGYTLLDIQIIKLKKIGIKRIIINLHYYGKIIKEHLDRNPHTGVEIIFSEEPVILGTGGGIAKAEKFFHDETIMVINSDIISDLSLQDFMTFYENNPSISAFTVWPSKNYHDYALVRYNEKDKLAGFLLKEMEPNHGDKTGIFMGYYILTPEARSYLKPKFSSVISDFYQIALQEGKLIDIYLHQGIWIDIGTQKTYAYASDIISERKLSIDSLLR
jgi:NDP-sugar pyrophosphorylase family protein